MQSTWPYSSHQHLFSPAFNGPADASLMARALRAPVSIHDTSPRLKIGNEEGVPVVTMSFGGNNGPPIGADVYAADGKRIGFLMGGDAHELEIGNGFLFTRVCAVPLHCVDRYEDGQLLLNLTAEQVEERCRS